MDKKLYKLMNWPAIEGIVYSECDNPHDYLGQHVTPNGLLIQAFMPGASCMVVKIDGQKKNYTMEEADEAGFFAVLIPGRKKVQYTLFATFPDGQSKEYRDPYSYDYELSREALTDFTKGINYNVYDLLGAHVCEVCGVPGTRFAVWAPNAVRVSVVGDFNNWDGRTHQMRKDYESGVFDLFIPEIYKGTIYKYEIKFKGGLTGLKSDPYAFEWELRPANASVVSDISGFTWEDKDWISKRDSSTPLTKPMSVYEMHLGSFRKPPAEEEREFYTYRELAPMVIEYIKEMNYTHVELMPVTEYPFDASWGYQVTGYYAPTSRYGTPLDFKYFINELHKAGIGVILDWVPAHFPRDTFGLSNFDGTCLYEHFDPRQGSHPDWGTLIYNYGRPQVKNFLIGSALFWAEEYHVDGIRSDAVASMLYLDYGKRDGEWVANMYGGKENLEAIEFIKHLNSIFKKKKLSTLLIAEESTAWPMVTGDVENDSLGYDLKWNMGWMNDFTNFMRLDPLFRKGHYGELTFSMIYNYSENFILVLSHDEVVHGKASMLYKMPGETDAEKFANLRVAYGFMYMHPGKKLLFMGQDFGQKREWSEEREIDWELLQYDDHARMKEYVRDLNHLYRSEPALYDQDYVTDGFKWINCISADETILVFERIAASGEELIVVANFTPVKRANYKIGVPHMGKYKEIFNSDSAKYGGDDFTNPRLKMSKEEECDGLADSIRIKVPPMGISVFRYIPVSEGAVVDNETTKKNVAAKTPAGEKTSAKKAVVKKPAAVAKTPAGRKSGAVSKSKSTNKTVKKENK